MKSPARPSELTTGFAAAFLVCTGAPVMVMEPLIIEVIEGIIEVMDPIEPIEPVAEPPDIEPEPEAVSACMAMALYAAKVLLLPSALWRVFNQ